MSIFRWSSHAAPQAWQNLHPTRQSWIWEQEIHKCNLYSHTHPKHFPKDSRITSIPRKMFLHSLLLKDINKLMRQIIREEKHETKLVLLKVPYCPEILCLSKAQTNNERKNLTQRSIRITQQHCWPWHRTQCSNGSSTARRHCL